MIKQSRANERRVGDVSLLLVHLPKAPGGKLAYPDPCDPLTPAHDPALSGKMAVLMHMLGAVQRGVDRTVVVSGYTSTLDVVAAACEAADIGKITRLDGSVGVVQARLV